MLLRFLAAWAAIWLITGIVRADAPSSVEDGPTSAGMKETLSEDADLPLIHPYNALIRSAVVPGWGQVSIRQPIQGTLFFTATVGLLAGWWVVRREYRSMYDEEYLPAVERYGLNSDEAESIYRDVNARFRVSRTLLLTAGGIWLYGLIDAYVDAAIFNAELRAERLIEETRRAKMIEIEWRDAAPTLRLNFEF